LILNKFTKPPLAKAKGGFLVLGPLKMSIGKMETMLTTTDGQLSNEFASSISGAQLTIKLLEQHGITHIAGIPGGANLPLYDALVDSPIIHILTRHEQGAGFIAQGMARVNGKPQVCFASSGPGATNLVTAVADAKMDSIPLIAITGQVTQELIGTDAFQEVDTFGLMLPITKHNFMVRSAAELLSIIPEAFHIATSGRPGPVAVDIPKDIQLEQLSIESLPPPRPADVVPLPDPAAIDALIKLLQQAKRPILMVGGGALHSHCHRELLAFAESQDLPIVCSFMGLGLIPNNHPLNLGMLGMHGARCTNLLVDECDLLIGAGVRFDDRATGKVSGFCPTATIVHIDIDASEIEKIKSTHLSIRADLGTTIRQLLNCLPIIQRPQWLARMQALKQRFPLQTEVFTNNIKPRQKGLNPYQLLNWIAESSIQEPTIVTDVGQHQMWTAQAYPFTRPRQWISSGGLGTMGFGLPAAIGAALGEPGRSVICISGDGSIFMNIQELDTLAELQLNIKIVIMNNQNLGLVRQQQALFYGGRLKALGNRRALRFAPMAAAMGINAVDLHGVENPRQKLVEALGQVGPCLIDVPIDEDAKVFPMVPPGAANSDMIASLQT
jgi:acetolactate synthase-1/2/3 large subunit